MKKIPLTLKIMCLALVGVAMSFPIQIMFLYEHNIVEVNSIMSKISWVNMMAMSACILNVPFILRGSRWMMATVPVSILFVAYNNFIVAQVGQDYSAATTLWATAAFVLLYSPILTPKVIEILKHPEKRWWLQCSRKKAEIPVQVDILRGESFTISTFDISNSGAFIPASSEVDASQNLKPGDHFSLSFSLGEFRKLKCDAEIVRTMPEAKGHYPQGYGIRFLNLEIKDRKILDEYIHQLPINDFRSDHLAHPA